MRIIDHLVDTIRKTFLYNPETQVAPACILWPDKDRHWEAAISLLRPMMPELLCLGDYILESHTGPAIWLRCAIAGKIPDVQIPDLRIPVLYLPGVSRQDLRAIESCPMYLKPLAELQYRGVIWSQLNAKDWTVLAYLKTVEGGLGLDVAQTSEAKNAMQLALSRLLEEDISLLQGKRLDEDYFNTLLSGGDPIRDILHWLNDGDVFRGSRSENEWKAFCQVCFSFLAFHPQKKGILAGAEKLARHEGPWNAVWERFCEAPKRYANIPNQIRKCKPPSDTMFWFSGEDNFDGWPQWNEDWERSLMQELMALERIPTHEARKKLLELEKKHGSRRQLLWAELDEAPLAYATGSLAELAVMTTYGLTAGTLEDVQSGYESGGWKADNAVMSALAHTRNPEQFTAVSMAIRAVYLPWAESSARYLQKLLSDKPYPGGSYLDKMALSIDEGTCVLFIDGLRYDTSMRLQKQLELRSITVTSSSKWTTLPSVTATGKPAVSPIRTKLKGSEATTDFEPEVAATGQSIKGGYHFKKLLVDAGWAFLEKEKSGTGVGHAWCEFGDIDHEGHDRGWKLAKHLDSMLIEISDRISTLLDAGWKWIRIVTDHGWLVMPGGLPKTELPSALADSKWGRCAVMKPGVASSEKYFPWYWDPDQSFALADGISCFRNGEEYAHGGLSFQECLTLQLDVTRKQSVSERFIIEVTDLGWKGMRCTVVLAKPQSDLWLDVRLHAGDKTSSVIVEAKRFNESGKASVVVEDDDILSEKAYIVVLGENKAILAQFDTIIGGGQ